MSAVLSRREYHWTRQQAYTADLHARMLDRDAPTMAAYERRNAIRYRAEVTPRPDLYTASVNLRWERLRLALRIAARCKRMVRQALAGKYSNPVPADEE